MYSHCIPTLYFLLPAKRGSQRLPSGAKHPVRPGVAVPETAPSVGKVLDSVPGEGQLGGVVTVTGIGVPIKVSEGPLQNTKEAVHIAHNKLRGVHHWIPQDSGDDVIRSAHARLFFTLYYGNDKSGR